ncbi:glycosyltransferase [Campylobacter devanensis]|uniref:glycosyltransferase n=1 Tax=Campylobacter devanensis TaxID=3161138 RepID=UPI000A3347E5|nr:glycosyltransferase [Campylobacter sp. P0134]
MKIGFVISTLGFGGAERVLSILANNLSSKHEITIFKFDRKAPFYEIDEQVRVVSLSLQNSGILGSLKRVISKIFVLRKIFKSGEFDLIISFMDSTNLLCLMANLGLKQRLIISEHSEHSFLSLKWRVAKRLLYPFCDALSLLSKNDYEYYKYVKNRAVIYNPFFGEIGADFDESKKENLIIFVGRLESVKGCDIFLNSLKFCNIGDFSVEICGDGSEFEKFKSEFKSDRVKFKGSVSDISSYYKRAKIIVSSSRSEGLGNVLIEACFYKVARIATPTVGACELIEDGKNGLISSDFTPQSLAKKLNLAIQDENLRAKIAQNGYKNRASFMPQNITQEWLNLINRVLK